MLSCEISHLKQTRSDTISCSTHSCGFPMLSRYMTGCTIIEWIWLESMKIQSSNLMSNVNDSLKDVLHFCFLFPRIGIMKSTLQLCQSEKKEKSMWQQLFLPKCNLAPNGQCQNVTCAHTHKIEIWLNNTSVHASEKSVIHHINYSGQSLVSDLH